MDKFLDLLRESVIGQILLLLLFAGAVVYLVCVGRDVPPDMWKVLWLIVGFYFGSKVENVKTRSLRR